MYRVLIADDEQIIREGISRAVPWATLGFELAGAAEDGVDALEKAKQLHPDVVITDIRMPKMDGLQLIRALCDCCPNCKLLILTGYGEFGYARSALQLGVSDYLLKPVDLNSLSGVLVRLRKELDEKNSYQSKIDQLQRQVQLEGALRQQRLLRRYLEGRTDTEKLLNGLPEAWKSASYCAGVLVQMDNFDHLTSEMSEEHIFTFTQELENILIGQGSDENMCLVESDGGRYFVLFVSQQEEELRFQLRSYVHRVRAAAGHTSYTTITSSVVHGSVSECRRAFDETRRCMDQAFLFGTGQDIQASEAVSREFSAPLPAGIDMRRITQTLSGFHQEEIRSTLRDIAEHIRRTTHNSHLYTGMLVSFVYGEMLRLLAEMKCPVQSILPDPMADYRRLMACQSLDNMMKELMKILDAVCAFLEQNVSGSQDAVTRAQMYIKAHFSDARLSLDMVAGAVGIAPTYLSALFKQNANKSFVGFLTETRLHHAKKLLCSSNYRTYEVAYMCGYDNSTYFSTIFKRYVGMSPSEYRRRKTEDECLPEM